ASRARRVRLRMMTRSGKDGYETQNSHRLLGPRLQRDAVVSGKSAWFLVRSGAVGKISGLAGADPFYLGRQCPGDRSQGASLRRDGAISKEKARSKGLASRSVQPDAAIA